MWSLSHSLSELSASPSGCASVAAVPVAVDGFSVMFSWVSYRFGMSLTGYDPSIKLSPSFVSSKSLAFTWSGFKLSGYSFLGAGSTLSYTTRFMRFSW